MSRQVQVKVALDSNIRTQFGSDLTLVALSGEVVVDYVAQLERAVGPRNLWIAAYCNDVFGYLPSSRVLREGGYETRGVIYGGVGLFRPEAEELVVSRVKKLVERLRAADSRHARE